MTTTDAAEKKQRAYLSSGSGTRAFFRRPGSSGGEVVSATSGPPHGVPFARSSTVAVDTSATEKRRWSALRPGSSGSNNGGTRTFFRRPGSSGREVVSATPGPFSRSSTVPVDTGATDSTEKKRWSALNLRPGSSGNNTGGTSFFRRPGSSGGEMVSATPGPPHGVPFARSSTMDAVPFSRNSKRSSWYSLTSSSKANPNDLAFKTDSDTAQVIKSPEAGKTHFGMSFPSILGLSSLSRTSTRDSTSDEKDRGRSIFRVKHGKSLSLAPAEQEGDTSSRSVSRARSQSPFSFRRFSRNRDTSPTLPQALPLSHSDAELSDTGSTVHPRSTAFSDDDSGDENDTDDEDSSPDEIIDPITERNTERNAVIPPPIDLVAGAAEIEDPDPVGEGVNIVVAPEPYFPSTLNSDIGSGTRGKRNTRKRKTLKGLDPLPFHTARPVFQRDRCTITITQGDPAGKLGGRKKRRYVVASDLSEESRYAVEWGIGTVLRDGDEMWLVTVIENESKTDPDRPNTADKTQKLRSQQERQGLAYILARQVTGILQRTRLNVTILCQAWHAKNSRHMLLDIVDYVEPNMLIVGSRGLGHLNGILLGSTSHYLIQKCSVPVMVARRRLKRPPKKSAHLSTQRVRVKLAEAGIDRVAVKVDQDVKVMRDEMQKEDSRRDGGPGSREAMGFTGIPEGDPEDEVEDENDDEPAGIKVSG